MNSRFDDALKAYVALIDKMRAAGRPPHSDYWAQSWSDARAEIYEAARVDGINPGLMCWVVGEPGKAPHSAYLDAGTAAAAAKNLTDATKAEHSVSGVPLFVGKLPRPAADRGSDAP